MLNKRIERILSQNEATRSDDRLLIIEIWEAYGFFLSEMQRRKFMNLPSSESIRRTRQSLQAKGLYKADPLTASRRKFKGLSVRQRIPGTAVHKIDPLLNERMF